MTIAVFETTI